MIQQHYGSFKSPISSELIVANTIRLGAVKVASGGGVFWNEGRPLEGGRNVLVFHDGHEVRDITPEPLLNVRSVVHEYGGGEYQVDDRDVYFSNFKDKCVYKLSGGGELSQITTENSCRYADFVLTTGPSKKIICVCEDHSGSGEAINTLVAINSADVSDIQVLVDGEDFYASPRLNPAGNKIAWLTWNHPNMPWDGTELWLADLIESELGILSLENIELVAGGAKESIFQPQWSPDGTLYFISDRTGWWNLYRWSNSGQEAVCSMEAEFGLPQWIFGQSTYAFTADGKIICSYVTDKSHLALLDPKDLASGPQEIPTDFTTIYGLTCNGNIAAFHGSSPTEFPAVIRLDLSTMSFQKLRSSTTLEIDPAYISAARHVEFPTERGKTAHGWYYAPKNRDFIGLDGECPPLLVKIHGGPTASTSSSLNLGVQYWTSRGFAVLDVDYGGSTGYGREYRDRLLGNWGVVDVEDCVNGAKYLVSQGLADEKRLAITGGSAGGYTALAALAFTDVFRAGASHYGICSLEALATDTHKFESRYLDGLIGKYPEDKDIYERRSPINSSDKLSCAIAFFQGLEDKVVLPNQAEMMVEALRRKGLPVAYVPFEGEQHGFRKAENIRRALDGEFYFYSRIFGFAPAEAAESIAIDIENAP